MNIGFRDVKVDPPNDLRWRMTASPTGRQLAIDGSLVVSLTDNDPNTSDEIPPDGTTVIYDRSGTKELWAFDRANGWQQL